MNHLNDLSKLLRGVALIARKAAGGSSSGSVVVHQHRPAVVSTVLSTVVSAVHQQQQQQVKQATPPVPPKHHEEKEPPQAFINHSQQFHSQDPSQVQEHSSLQDAVVNDTHSRTTTFVPRERAVPSNSVSRALGFAGLGAGLLFGAAQNSLARVWKGPSSDSSSAYGSFLSETNAERLANALCRMRGAALKLGQMLSIQDENVLPPQFQAALQRVRAGADVMPRRQLERALRNELGNDWRSRLAEFEDSPMAAASIGQVHAGILLDGRPVAIKVQYPGVAKSIEADVDNLMRLIRVSNILPKGLYVENAVAVAKKELALECDYMYEAQAQTRFASLVDGDEECRNAYKFHVPAVIPELTSTKVLTTERVPGVAIDRVASMTQEIRDAVGTRLLALTLKELYEWRFMQTDPNWGNFLYDAPTDTLHLIDFGAAREYPESFVSEYLEMVRSCAEGNEEGIVKRSTALGFLTGDESKVMLDAHVQAAIAVGTPFSRHGLYDFGSHGHLTKKVTELGAVMLKHRLTPPPDESYSLHRKLSGAFLACIKLRSRVPCRRLFYDMYDRVVARGSPRSDEAVVGG